MPKTMYKGQLLLHETQNMTTLRLGEGSPGTSYEDRASLSASCLMAAMEAVIPGEGGADGNTSRPVQNQLHS